MIRNFSTIIILLTAFSVGSITVDSEIASSIFDRTVSFDASCFEGESSNSEVIQADSHHYWSLSNSVLLYHRFLNNFYQLNPHSLAIRAPPIS